MFRRWKLGSLREAVLLLKHVGQKPLLVFDVWANHLVSFMQLAVRLGIIVLAFYQPICLLYYFIVTSIISLMYAIEMMRLNIKEVPFKLGYSIMNEIFFSWVLVDALLHFKRQGKWTTR